MTKSNQIKSNQIKSNPFLCPALIDKIIMKYKAKIAVARHLSMLLLQEYLSTTTTDDKP
jgi:hypothetical protein